MHNTYLLTLVMTLTASSASAQFYTITKESELYGNMNKVSVETADTKNDTIVISDTIPSGDKETVKEENSGETILNARKSDDYKSSRILSSEVVATPIYNDPSGQHSTALNETNSLPELTIPNLIAEIKKNSIKYPKIVLAQAILETGWFKSSVCRNKHNLFGLTNPRTGKYYEFNHWTESVSAYKSKVQYKYSGGNYLLWLDKIGYAEEKTYVRALIRVLKQL